MYQALPTDEEPLLDPEAEVRGDPEVGGESPNYTRHPPDRSSARKIPEFLYEWRKRRIWESTWIVYGLVLFCALLGCGILLLMLLRRSGRDIQLTLYSYGSEERTVVQFDASDMDNHPAYPTAKLSSTTIPFILERNFTPTSRMKTNTNDILSYLSASRTLISPLPPTCHLTEWHLARYAPIIESGSKIFLALNLHNNEVEVPIFIQSLPTLFSLLGPSRFFVSVYENGSDDKTPLMLVLLSRMLDSLGVSYKINSEGSTHYSDMSGERRIEVLANARNLALGPLYSSPLGKYDTVLFMNDVQHCAADVLEVLLQHYKQGASMSCSVDWQSWVVYDRWVLRSMTGHVYYEHQDLVEYWDGKYTKGVPPILQMPEDKDEKERFEKMLPTQVFSCWTGMAAIDARAFYPPLSIRFRQANNMPHPTELASECFLLPVDLWKAKMTKIQVVPRAAVAYTPEWYTNMRRDNLTFALDQEEELEKIDWKLTPPEKIGYQDRTVWWGDERWAPWDEAKKKRKRSAPVDGWASLEDF